MILLDRTKHFSNNDQINFFSRRNFAEIAGVETFSKLKIYLFDVEEMWYKDKYKQNDKHKKVMSNTDSLTLLFL